jgi:hypothetical protein
MGHASEDSTYGNSPNLGETANSIQKQTQIIGVGGRPTTTAGLASRRQSGVETTSVTSSTLRSGGHHEVKLLRCVEETRAPYGGLIFEIALVETQQGTRLVLAIGGNLLYM